MDSNKKLLFIILFTVSLASIAIALSYIEIPWPLSSFLKLDLSEIVVLFSLVILGFKNSLSVIVLKTIGRRLIRGFNIEGLVGEAIALVACFSIVLGYYIVKKLILKDKSKPLIYYKNEYDEDTEKDVIFKTPLYGLFAYTIVITILLTIFMFLINLFFSTPFYLSLTGTSISGKIHFSVFSYIKDNSMFDSFNSFLKFCLITYIPFNFVKGLILTSIFSLTLNRLPKVLNIN